MNWEVMLYLFVYWFIGSLVISLFGYLVIWLTSSIRQLKQTAMSSYCQLEIEYWFIGSLGTRN
jgi:hypothetical protein